MTPFICFDTETYPFGPRNMAPKIVCLSWAEKKKASSITRAKAKAHLLIGKEIENWLIEKLTLAGKGNLLIVGHNVAYDFACVLSTFPQLVDLVFSAYAADSILCTKIREQLLDIAAGTFRGEFDSDGQYLKRQYTLADLANRYSGPSLDKGDDSWRMRYAELDGVPLEQWPEAAKSYAIMDAEATWHVFYKQGMRARRETYSLPTQFNETKASFALKLASTWGFKVDEQSTHKLWFDISIRMKELGEKLVDCGLARPPNLSKKQQEELEKEKMLREPLPRITKNLKNVKSKVEEAYSPGMPPLTAKGQISTARETLEACRDSDLELLVEFTQLQKTASTYLTKMFDGIVHASFEAIGARSSRTSCHHPNLQNLPRLPGVRECFQARPGMVLLAADFDSQEMRTLAQTCMDLFGQSKLATRYQQDRNYDPHLDFASELAKMDQQEFFDAYEDGNAWAEKLRQQAKVANFGFPGGMGSESFRFYAKGWGIELSIEEAIELKNEWLSQWPEMRLYFNHVSNLVGSTTGTLEIPQSKFKRGACVYTQACNGYFQGLGAHATKSALWEATNRCFTDRQSALYGFRPVAFIHDELILEGPEEIGHEAGEELVDLMVQEMENWTPDVPSAASAILMYQWSKKAKSVFDSSGRLVPWTK